MLLINKIQLQSLCSYHSLPFTHICIGRLCQCQIKLCEKCCTQHENQNQNSSILKIDNFQNKIQTEIEIYQKQRGNHPSSKISQNLKQTKDKFQKFSVNQVNTLEQTMKYLNQEGDNVIEEIKQASDNIYQQIITINKKRAQIPQKYSLKIIQNNLIPIEVQFLNQKGFNLFRKKLDKMLIFRKIINEFLQNAQKYGSQYENFINITSKTISNENSMKRTITDVLPKYRKVDQKAHTDANFYPKLQNPPQQRANNLIQHNPNIPNQPDHIRKKRATTIFGKK